MFESMAGNILKRMVGVMTCPPTSMMQHTALKSIDADALPEIFHFLRQIEQGQRDFVPGIANTKDDVTLLFEQMGSGDSAPPMVLLDQVILRMKTIAPFDPKTQPLKAARLGMALIKVNQCLIRASQDPLMPPGSSHDAADTVRELVFLAEGRPPYNLSSKAGIAGLMRNILPSIEKSKHSSTGLKQLASMINAIVPKLIEPMAATYPSLAQSSSPFSGSDISTSCSPPDPSFFRGVLPGDKASKVANRLPEHFTTDDVPYPFLYVRFKNEQFLLKHLGKEVAKEELNSLYELPPGITQERWLYAHIKIFISDLGLYACQLETVCNARTCPKMIATPEWQFLCSAPHPKLKGGAKECCAIDYITHTIDSIGREFVEEDIDPSIPPDRYLGMCKDYMRRLYRILAHGYFNHRTIHKDYESAAKLQARMDCFCRKFDLLPRGLYIEALAQPRPKSQSKSLHGYRRH
jgi:hypothetical protein